MPLRTRGQAQALLGNGCFLKPNVLANLWMRVEQAKAKLLLKVYLVPLGLETNLRKVLVFRNHVHPSTVSFFSHDGVLMKY